MDVDSPFQPVHINSTSSLGQTTASHFASTIALVLANLGPLVLASSLMRSRAPSFVKSRASESVETRTHRSCVYRQCILVSNLRPGLHYTSTVWQWPGGAWEMVVELSYNLIVLCFLDIQIHHLHKLVVMMRLL